MSVWIMLSASIIVLNNFSSNICQLSLQLLFIIFCGLFYDCLTGGFVFYCYSSINVKLKFMIMKQHFVVTRLYGWIYTTIVPSIALDHSIKKRVKAIHQPTSHLFLLCHLDENSFEPCPVSSSNGIIVLNNLLYPKLLLSISSHFNQCNVVDNPLVKAFYRFCYQNLFLNQLFLIICLSSALWM